jgi:hypothetical protein
MVIKTKKQAKELGYCKLSVLLNKYSRVPQTEGVLVKDETFYKPDEEEIVKSRTAWKKEGRQIKKGASSAGEKHMHRGKSIKYDVYKYIDTIDIDYLRKEKACQQ